MIFSVSNIGLNSRAIAADDLMSEHYADCFSDVSADESTDTKVRH
jgi:hypothetical protein